MDFEEWFNTYGNLQCDKDSCEDAFDAGQQSKQAEIDAIKSKLSDIYDASDEDETVAHLLDEIQELLK